MGHAPTRGIQFVGEEWRVESCFPTGFPPTCRSASCSLEYEVSGRRRAGRKKSPATRRSDGKAARRSDGDGNGGGFRKENKLIGRKHDHWKKKIRFSLLTLIPCEERKGRIPNFYYINRKN